MKKKLLIGAAALLGLVIAGAGLLFYWMSRPLYTPGALRTAALTVPGQSASGDFWDMGDGVRLHRFFDGAGSNILFVHGGPGFPTRTPPAGLRQLAGSHRLVYYDQRGCGKSTRPVDRFTSSNYYENVKTLDAKLGLGAQVADIERIRRILGDEKLTLIGHSWGGFVAALYAAEFPERVKAMILVAPADILQMPSETGGMMDELRRRLPAAKQPEYDAFLKQYLDFRNVFARTDEDLKKLNLRFAEYYIEAAKAANFALPADFAAEDAGGWMTQGMYFSMGMRHDYRPALKAVKAPVLVMHGDRDLQSEKATRSYAEALPNAQFALIPGAGHWIFADQPDAFAAAAGRFLTAVK